MKKIVHHIAGAALHALWVFAAWLIGLFLGGFTIYALGGSYKTFEKFTLCFTILALFVWITVVVYQATGD